MQVFPIRLVMLLAAVACPLVAQTARNSAGNPGQEKGAAQALPGAPRIAVAPFEMLRRDPRYDWLGEGLAELAIEELAADAGENAGLAAQVIPREEWLAALERMGLPAGARFSRATLLKIGNELDADSILVGRYATDGKALSISARLLHIHPAQLSAEVSQSGAFEDVLEVEARVSWQIRSLVVPEMAVRACCQAPGRGRAPSRVDSFEAYARGMAAADEAVRIRLLREAARLDPQWDLPAFALGKSYLARRDCTNAVLWFEKLRGDDPWRAAEAAFDAGVCWLQRDEPARARHSLAATNNVTPAELWNNLGVAHLRLGEWQEAAAATEESIRLEPDSPAAWFNLGLAAFWADGAAIPAPRRDSGARAFREALRQKPEDLEIRAWLVAALERTGRTAEAEALREDAPGRLPVIPAGAGVPAARKQKGRAGATLPEPPPYARIGRLQASLEAGWRTRERRGNGGEAAP